MTKARPEIITTVARNLKRLRRERGWSQEHLAFESGLHRTYISGLERGVRNPTVTVLDRLAETLGVGPEELVKRG